MFYVGVSLYIQSFKKWWNSFLTQMGTGKADSIKISPSASEREGGRERERQRGREQETQRETEAERGERDE